MQTKSFRMATGGRVADLLDPVWPGWNQIRELTVQGAKDKKVKLTGVKLEAWGPDPDNPAQCISLPHFS